MTTDNRHFPMLSVHQRGRLLPLLREAAAEEACVFAASERGLAVSTAELQRAADADRQRLGLASAEDTRRWLAQNQLSVTDFEERIERDLLIEKLKDHLAVEGAQSRFDADPAQYARVRLWELAVPSDGHARELLRQLTDDGAEFADLARRFSILPSRDRGGEVGVLCRAALPPKAAEAVFAASAGATVGPFLAAGGYHLLHVAELLPPALDDATRAVLRLQIFDDWLREQMAGVTIDLSWLSETPNEPG